MNGPLAVWLQTAALTAVEAAAIIGIVAQMQRRAESGTARKSLWQICILTALVLAVCELSGVGRGLAAWSRDRLAPPAPVVRENGKSVAAPAVVPDVAAKIEPVNQGGLFQGASGYGVPPSGGGAWAGTEISRTLNPPGNSGARPAEAGTPYPGMMVHAALESRSSSQVAVQGKNSPNDSRKEILNQRENSYGAALDSLAPSEGERVGVRGFPSEVHGKSGSTPSQPLAGTNYLALMLGVWLLGAALVGGWLFITRIVFGVFRLRASQVEDASLRESVRKLARGLGIRRRIRMIESPRFAGPVAFGLLRPVIGLPVGFCGRFNSNQREAMLAHELAHLAGYDVAWYLLADVLAAVLWWHPLVWWARRQLHSATELAADEASLLIANGPVVLAECLVELGGRLTRSQTAWRLGMAGNDFHSGLGRRVGRLVDLDGAVWRPPSPLRAGLAKSFGTLGLVAITIFSSAWVAPTALTKGENMQVIKQTWRKSLAAIVLLAGATTHGQTTAAPQTSPSVIAPADPAAAPVPTTTTFRELIKDPNYQLAATTPGAVAPAPGSLADPNAQVPAAPTPTPAAGVPATPPGVSPPGNLVVQSAPQVAALFGGRGTPGGFPGQSNPARAAVEAALERITLDEVDYLDLPLNEVIKRLVGTSEARDPEKRGINIVMDRQSGANSPEWRLDPATGLPQQWTVFDLESTQVKIDPPLRHIRLIDVLDAITKSTDRPIKYSIEDYGILISVDWEKLILNQGQSQPAALDSKAFKLDLSVARSSLSALGAYGAGGLPVPPDPNAQAQAVTGGLRKLLEQMGINVSDPKRSILYNPTAGVLMVRSTVGDMGTITALVATVGGTPYAPAADGMPATQTSGVTPPSLKK